MIFSMKKMCREPKKVNNHCVIILGFVGIGIVEFSSEKPQSRKRPESAR